MRIAICDDDKSEREDFIAALRGWDPTRYAECFGDGASLLRAAESQPPFSIVFLDIYMPEENGMDIARKLREISPETGIVFVTTSPDHAVEAFSLQAVHYLVKPVTTAGIREAFARIQKQQAKMRSVLSVKFGHGQRSLYLNEIISLESNGHQVIITMVNSETVSAYTSIREIQALLDDTFLLVQRGLIVNMEHIESMQTDACILRTGQQVLLSRKKRASIREAYNNHVFRKLSSLQSLDKDGDIR